MPFDKSGSPKIEHKLIVFYKDNISGLKMKMWEKETSLIFNCDITSTIEAIKIRRTCEKKLCRLLYLGKVLHWFFYSS